MQALLRFDELIKELEVGSQRPVMYFAAHSAVPWKFDHVFGRYQDIHHLLARRACVWLELGDSEAALKDLQLMNVLLLRFTSEPSLMAALIRQVVAQLMTCVVYHGLERHVWSEEQLETIIGLLQGIDPISDLDYALQTERASLNDLIDWAKSKASPSIMGGKLQWNPFSWFSNDHVLRAFPGIVCRNQLRLYDYFVQLRNRLDLSHGIIRRDVPIPDGPLCSCDPDWNGYYELFNVAAPLVLPTEMRCGKTCSMLRLGALACTLERYHIENGYYPESLTELVPTYLPSMPHEPYSLEPLVYTRNVEGAYLLYSRGHDGKDDGGLLTNEKPPKGKPLSMPRDYKILDIPWQAPPASK